MTRVLAIRSRSSLAALILFLVLLTMPQQIHAERIDAGSDQGTGVGVRPAGAEGTEQGVPEQARARHGRSGRRDGAEGAAPRVLRLLRLALVRARPLDAGAAAPRFPGLARADRDPGHSGRTLHGREPESRGRLLRAQGEQVVRTALRLGVAAQAGGGAPRLGRPRRQGLGDRTSGRSPT